ncbi:MAG: hypothetical protein GY932_14840 [Arcobacter sp.]|nr:hypothetical protein [Arcobacter sp.]
MDKKLILYKKASSILMKADYRKLDKFILNRAFYALSSYLVQAIADKIEHIEDSWRKLKTW